MVVVASVVLFGFSALLTFGQQLWRLPAAPLPLTCTDCCWATATVVSLIMPTRDRHRLVQFQLDQLAQQRLPPGIQLELVIVDQSSTCSQQQTVIDRVFAAVRWFCVGSDLSIGAMRNFGVRRAHGQFIVHVDDDEVYREDRLAMQLAPLLAGDAELTALPFAKLLHALDKCRVTVFIASPEEEEAAAAAVVDDDEEPPPFEPHFGSLAYARHVWNREHRQYPETSLAEDFEFASAAANDHGFRFLVLQDDDVMLHSRHGRNANSQLTPEAASQQKTVAPPNWLAERQLIQFCNLLQSL